MGKIKIRGRLGQRGAVRTRSGNESYYVIVRGKDGKLYRRRTGYHPHDPYWRTKPWRK